MDAPDTGRTPLNAAILGVTVFGIVGIGLFSMALLFTYFAVESAFIHITDAAARDIFSALRQTTQRVAILAPVVAVGLGATFHFADAERPAVFGSLSALAGSFVLLFVLLVLMMLLEPDPVDVSGPMWEVNVVAEFVGLVAVALSSGLAGGLTGYILDIIDP